jgi:hypothetical protein
VESGVFIRWITRGHKSPHATKVTFHDAYLVESYRNENGQPRQRIITYLGNIREIGGTLPGIERELFLLRAVRALSTVPNLTEEEREHLTTQLHRRVPPLSRDEVIEGFRNTIHWYHHWLHEHGGAPSQEEILALIEAAAERPSSW